MVKFKEKLSLLFLVTFFCQYYVLQKKIGSFTGYALTQEQIILR
jgi:hypothetical protein